ncbi:GNAT family N-acetyltransferase [Oscillatoria sp. FACHB-1407]|uniref:GNAT family N-acetyltransferase n=1 Tax=Oscillatoria sp. FACHB-1407 TaxID=2692847 RepID=UPI00168272A0|nr:GNAT family N-acetyltransferase [Oscillatoria sp. FACHB-1407]MBD2459844.1 GNAT family N-acetyltransferase [Oscillatoria sp. FACHB-1407]
MSVSVSLDVSSSVTIRPANVEDLPAILELLHLKAEFDGCPESLTATPEQLKQDLFGENVLSYVLLAEVNGSPAGFATYHRIYSTFIAKPGIWLDDLYLKPQFRSQGIGRSLILKLCEIAQKMGCGRIDWTVAFGNDPAIAFYKAMGANLMESVRLCRLTEEAIAQNLSQY